MRTIWREVQDAGRIVGYEEVSEPKGALVKSVNGERVLLNEHDLAQREIDEAAWNAGAPQRKAEEIERASGMSRKDRDLAKLLPAGHYLRTKAEEAEAAIAALGVRK